MRPRRLALVALALVAAGVVAPAADAFVLAGRPWPVRTIRYAVTDARVAVATRLAADVWNRSGVRVRFVETSRARARVLVAGVRGGDATFCFGDAVLGHVPGVRSRVRLSRGCPPGDLAPVAAHELGHVLGLGHERRRCALMSPVVRQRCGDPLPPVPWVFHCALLAPDDLRGALRLYGGRAAPPPLDPWCGTAPLPPLVARAAARVDPAAPGAVRLRWRAPRSRLVRRVVVDRLPGPCRVRGPLGDVGPGQTGETVWDSAWAGARSTRGAGDAVDLDARPGRRCYAVWTLDRRDRHRVRPRFVRVAVPEGLPSLAARIRLAAAPSGPGRLRVTWAQPDVPGATRAEVVATPGRCPTRDDLDGRVTLDGLRPGLAAGATVAAPPGGPLCVGVWVGFAERTEGPATVPVAAP